HNKGETTWQDQTHANCLKDGNRNHVVENRQKYVEWTTVRYDE
nr:hypothetical protein [Scyliorhinus torazame]